MAMNSPAPSAALVDTSAAVTEKPPRKGLGKKQLAWARKHIPYFSDMEAASKASKEPVKK